MSGKCGESAGDAGIFVSRVVGDNLYGQQKGFRTMTGSATIGDIRGIVVVPCANQTLNLAFRNTLDGQEDLKYYVREVTNFQNVMRTNKVIRQYKKRCPAFPETRWIYICGVLNWIISEKDTLLPFIMQCAEFQNDVWVSLKDRDLFVDGLPDWVEPFRDCPRVVEGLNLHFESSKIALWMVVRCVERAQNRVEFQMAQPANIDFQRI
jgi:hypothetical protein